MGDLTDVAMRILCLVTAFLCGILVSANRSLGQPNNSQERVSATRTIAIVPFTNLTEDPDDDWFGVGIAESLVIGFPAGAAVVAHGVRVPGGGTVRSNENQSSTDGLEAIGQELGVFYVVSGAYQRLGDALRVTAVMVEVATGMVLRSERVDGEVADLFALQDSLSAALSAPVALTSRSTDDQSAATPPPAAVSAVPSALSDAAELSRPPALAAGTVAPAGFSADEGAALAATIDGPPPPSAPEVVSRDDLGRATVRAIKLAEGINVDGQLDEMVYQEVLPISDFIQQVPVEGAPATEKTDAWIMFDEMNVYVGARVWDSAPESEWVANEMRRDTNQLRQNDTFTAFFDTFYDRRNGVNFYTNPLGARADQQFTNEGNPNGDWNPVWDVRTGRFEGGWTVEMEIPFKTLRYRSETPQLWGVQLRRSIRRKNEMAYLTRLPITAGGGSATAGIFMVSAAGTLFGLEPPPATRNIEIKPYVIGGITRDVVADPLGTNEQNGEFGLDIKYGITRNLTADLTYNTDFAQVEVDEQQMNLTRFSLFFPEKREFFLEGRGIFEFARGGAGGGFGFGGGGGGGFRGDDAPTLFYSRRIGLQGGEMVPIIGGGRVTGKLGQFDVGALSIQTNDHLEIGAEGTNFTVARIRRDILRRSSVGGIFTNRSVSLLGDGSNQAYGVDGTFAFYENIQMLGYFARTQTPGLDEKDASYQAKFGYGGDRYGMLVDHLLVEENFVPEVGFRRRDNIRRTFGEGRFSPRPRSIDAVRQFRFVGNIDYVLTADTSVIETRLNQFRFETELETSDRFALVVNDNYEMLWNPFSPGPDVTIPVGGYAFTDVELSYSIGEQRRANGSVVFQRGGYFGGDITTVGFQRGRIAILPQMSVEPSLSFNWIDTVFGSFRTDLAVTRINYAFNPRMFFSGLVQYNSARNTVSNNLRFRWEYSPGSELFVVYTEDRETSPLRPDRFTDLRNRGFVVKFNRLFRF